MPVNRAGRSRHAEQPWARPARGGAIARLPTTLVDGSDTIETAPIGRSMSAQRTRLALAVQSARRRFTSAFLLKISKSR
jgi:hypothetical protein